MRSLSNTDSRGGALEISICVLKNLKIVKIQSSLIDSQKESTLLKCHYGKLIFDDFFGLQKRKLQLIRELPAIFLSKRANCFCYRAKKSQLFKNPPMEIFDSF